MHFVLSKVAARIVRLLDELLLNIDSRSPGLLLLCLASSTSCDPTVTTATTTNCLLANTSFYHGLKDNCSGGANHSCLSHCKTETSRNLWSSRISRIPIFNFSVNSVGMNAKVAKTKIVMLDGCPYYRQVVN